MPHRGMMSRANVNAGEFFDRFNAEVNSQLRERIARYELSSSTFCWLLGLQDLQLGMLRDLVKVAVVVQQCQVVLQGN